MIPFYYDHINMSMSQVNPSTIHIRNTASQRYFTRYLLQRAISVFKWKIPKEWSLDYMLYSLYCIGYVAIIKTDKFGVIPQHCTLSGYDVFYRPAEILVTNQLFKGDIKRKIGTDCVLLRISPDYGGIMDLVQFYADKLALASETVDINLINSHLSMVFPATNKQTAESYKKMYDMIASGEPAVVVDKSLFTDTGELAVSPMVQNVGQNYIADRVLSDMRKIVEMFDTELGIPNSNTDKRERLITDEVNSNNAETALRMDYVLNELKHACDDVRAMFGVDISVDWRVDPYAGNNVNSGLVQLGANNI